MKRYPGLLPNLLKGSQGLGEGAGRRPALNLFKAWLTAPEDLGDLL